MSCEPSLPRIPKPVDLICLEPIVGSWDSMVPGIKVTQPDELRVELERGHEARKAVYDDDVVRDLGPTARVIRVISVELSIPAPHSTPVVCFERGNLRHGKQDGNATENSGNARCATASEHGDEQARERHRRTDRAGLINPVLEGAEGICVDRKGIRDSRQNDDQEPHLNQG
jgi:hypothetical protein